MEPSTILIVEDEPGILELLTVNLRGDGFQTIGASDGLEALRLFEQNRPDAVVLDLNLPKVSGFRLLDVFKHADRPVPVVAVTAYSFEEAQEVVRKGVDAFMTKPVDFDALSRTLSRLIAKSRGQDTMPFRIR